MNICSLMESIGTENAWPKEAIIQSVIKDMIFVLNDIDHKRCHTTRKGVDDYINARLPKMRKGAAKALEALWQRAEANRP